MHGLQQFFTDVANQALPTLGRVFYVRGGCYNIDGLLPSDPNPNLQASTPGNDHHRGSAAMRLSGPGDFAKRLSRRIRPRRRDRSAPLRRQSAAG
jgi:hypothetical protein